MTSFPYTLNNDMVTVVGEWSSGHPDEPKSLEVKQILYNRVDILPVVSPSDLEKICLYHQERNT